MKDLFRFIEAEVLQELDVRSGHLAQVVVVCQVEQPSGDYRNVRISSNKQGRSLRRNEVAGLLATSLSDVLDKK